MDKICGIYMIRNVENDMNYIGCAIDIDKRWKNHMYLLKNGVHKNKRLQNVYNKYGKDIFEYSVIQECDLENIKNMEL